jgi:hypothetical protein
VSTPRSSWLSGSDNTHEKWYKDGGLRLNVFFGVSVCTVIAINGCEQYERCQVRWLTTFPDGAGLIGGFQAQPAWQKFFNRPTGNLLGLYSAAYFLPSIVTSYLGDFISNRYGRRWAIQTGMLLMLIGGVINTFAVDIGMWVAGRAVIGAGVGIMKVLVVLSWRIETDMTGRSCRSGPRNLASSPPTDPRLGVYSSGLHWYFWFSLVYLCRTISSWQLGVEVPISFADHWSRIRHDCSLVLPGIPSMARESRTGGASQGNTRPTSRKRGWTRCFSAARDVSNRSCAGKGSPSKAKSIHRLSAYIRQPSTSFHLDPLGFLPELDGQRNHHLVSHSQLGNTPQCAHLQLPGPCSALSWNH